MKRKSFILVPLVLTVASLSLSGCSGSAVPTPAVASPTPHPALSDEKLASINDSIFGLLKETESSFEAEALPSRLSGPALVERRLAYKKKSLLGDATTLEAISDKVKLYAVSQGDVYPRVVVELTEAPEGENLQMLNVIVQPTARDNWTLWGAMRFLPSSAAPTVSTGEAGATMIAPDDTAGLVASPNAVLDAYIQLNKTRDDSKGLTFAEDALRTRLAKGQDKNASAVKDLGEASLDFSRGGSGPFAIRTDDGGALVLAELNYTSTIRVTKTGGKASIPENHDIAIAATGEANKAVSFGNSLTAYYTVALAFYVPPADAKDTTITLIANSSGAPYKVDVQ